jgi:hypothetical protein
VTGTPSKPTTTTRVARCRRRTAGPGRDQGRLGRLELLDTDPAEVSHRQVLRSLGEADAMAYARASAEITELAGWLSRLADALYQPDTKQPEPS